MSDMNQQQTPDESPRTDEAPTIAGSSSSRRQFVRELTRRAIYVAPVVVTLAATRSACAASGASGGS